MSKDDRGRIVRLQFIADRRVLGGIPGGGEVAIGRDDPRSRKHALPRHATVLALQGPGDARLPLATRRKAYVAAFRAVDLVVIAPPGEKPHTQAGPGADQDRKSTRLNSSHGYISYAVFCLKKKNKRLPFRNSGPRFHSLHH